LQLQQRPYTMLPAPSILCPCLHPRKRLVQIKCWK